MYRGIATMLFLLVMISGGPVWGQEQQAWVGHQFHPEQCVKIEPGKFPYKRKLCTIVYDIVWTNGLYTVNGTLLFDERFVPDKVKSVDIEVLLIGEDFVCKKQVNIPKEVKDGPVTFSLVVENFPDYRYVRTYYIIEYQG